MKRTLILAVLLALIAAVAMAGDHEDHVSKVQSTPQWEKMKSLVGHWEGEAEDSGQKFKATTNFRMTGDNSALMHTLAEGTPNEMISMVHTDGAGMMMTHYCAAHNQPRFRAAESKDPNRVVFEFLDVTNASPSQGHMSRVVFTFDGPDHHIEDWTYKQGDKETTGHFDFKRVK